MPGFQKFFQPLKLQLDTHFQSEFEGGQFRAISNNVFAHHPFGLGEGGAKLLQARGEQDS